MKLKAQLSGHEHSVSLALEGDTASAEIDGRHYDIEFRELGADAFSGEYLLRHGSNVYKCRVDKNRDSGSSANSFEVTLRGLVHDITIIDPKRLRSGQASATHDHGESRIISPMPGKIVRVLVKPGANVAAGDGIVIVEAMKMQNEMKAPKAGVVISINAGAGATVSAGDVLAVIE